MPPWPESIFRVNSIRTYFACVRGRARAPKQTATRAQTIVLWWPNVFGKKEWTSSNYIALLRRRTHTIKNNFIVICGWSKFSITFGGLRWSVICFDSKKTTQRSLKNNKLALSCFQSKTQEKLQQKIRMRADLTNNGANITGTVLESTGCNVDRVPASKQATSWQPE